MPYGTVNADVIQTSTSGGILGAGNASIMKNRCINGDMRIDQRNAGASVTPSSSAYTLDRWKFITSPGSKFSFQQSSTAPAGFTTSLISTSLSAYSASSGDVFRLAQFIEGYNVADLGFGTANAKTVTVSFWVRSSLTGTFAVTLINDSADRSYVSTYTVSAANTWEQKSVTIAGDTSGTWLTTNGVGIGVVFDMGSGTSSNTTAGAWQAGNYTRTSACTSVVGTNGATFYITGVQLEVGSSATGFEYVNYQTSLANCQRYYEVIDGVYSTNYNGASNRNDITNLVWKVTKRTAPTLVLVSSVGATGTNSLSAGSGSNAVQSFYISGAGLLPTAVISGSSEL
jgi:hypothetical protein